MTDTEKLKLVSDIGNDVVAGYKASGQESLKEAVEALEIVLVAIDAKNENLTLEEMKELQKKLNEQIIDREIALEVAKANHGGE